MKRICETKTLANHNKHSGDSCKLREEMQPLLATTLKKEDAT